MALGGELHVRHQLPFFPGPSTRAIYIGLIGVLNLQTPFLDNIVPRLE